MTDTTVENLPFGDLMNIDELLKCNICYSYFDTCMMTSCGHNYCSVCIRTYMSHKAECPICQTKTAEPSLQKNETIDQILKAWKSFKSLLNTNKSTCSGEATPKESRETNSSKKTLKKYLKKPLEEKVTCELCGVELPKQNLDKHLEEIHSNKPRNRCSKRIIKKPLPKVVYNLLTVRQLQAKMKECGLKTNGDKNTLVKRHQRFRILYNANCDSSDTRSVEDIIKQVYEEEAANKRSTAFELNKINRNTPAEIIEASNDAYRKKHDKQFKELIECAKSRKRTACPVVSASTKILSACKISIIQIDSENDSDDDFVETPNKRKS